MTNNKFKIHSFKEFTTLNEKFYFNDNINEKYYTYDELIRKPGSSSGWRSKDLLIKDATQVVKNMIPSEDIKIRSTEDQSTDKGIKLEFKLNTRDVLHMFKNGRYAQEWEVYLNKKKSSKNDVMRYLIENHMSILDRYIRALKVEDWYSMYSDDPKIYKSKGGSEDLVDLYSKLNNSDKKKAIKAYVKYGPKGDIPDIETFTGI